MNAFEFQRSSRNIQRQYLLNLSQLWVNDSVNEERKNRYNKISTLILNDLFLINDSSALNDTTKETD